MTDFAYDVAQNIYHAAESGSAVWDEVNGPDAEWDEENDGFQLKQIIRIPAEYDDETHEVLEWCRITVEVEMKEPPFDENHHRYHTPAAPLEGCANCKFAGWLN